jgi:hypothetical protein
MIPSRIQTIQNDKQLKIAGAHMIKFDPQRDLIFHMDKTLPQHPNGMRFSVYNEEGDVIMAKEYFSIGGGFVVTEETRQEKGGENVFYRKGGQGDDEASRTTQKYANAALPFNNAAELLQICEREGKTIAQVRIMSEFFSESKRLRPTLLRLFGRMNSNGVPQKTSERAS